MFTAASIMKLVAAGHFRDLAALGLVVGYQRPSFPSFPKTGEL